MTLFGSIRYNCAYLLFYEILTLPQTLKSFDFEVISHQQNIKQICFVFFYVGVFIQTEGCVIKEVIYFIWVFDKFVLHYILNWLTLFLQACNFQDVSFKV